MVEQDLSVDADSDAEPPARAAIGGGSRRVGNYRILGEIGRGGMGVVYEAEQVSLGRRVALKVLPRHFAQDPRALERFRREAKAAARLHHTNIVPVFEVGQDGETAYYAMQLIRGQGLDQIVEELRRLRESGREADGHEPAKSEGRETAETVVGPRMDAPSSPQGRELDQTMGMLLTGRLAAEGSGVVGRGEDAESGLAGTERFDPAATSGQRPEAPRLDVRPAPVAPDRSPSAVLPGGKRVSEVDTSGHRRPYFRSVAQIGRQTAQGLGYAHARGIVHRDIKPSNLLLDTEGVVWITDFGLAKADDDGLTASGDILGTLRYMAPERFRGEADARADIYALGLTLYELLILRPAYDSTDRLRLIERIKNEEPARPRSIDPQIPRDLQTIVTKAMDKHPDHRYQTAEALAEDLRRFLADEPIKARQISTSERYWRWARRNPVVATLGGVLTAVLVMATIGSWLMTARFAKMAKDASNSATSERVARIEADGARHESDRARIEADRARTTAVEAGKTAETARTAALAETYHAMLSEVKALRAGRQLGWRDEALANLARLAVMPTPRRDLPELRTEAVATVGEFGVKEVARFAVSGWGAFSIDFGPESRTLVTATGAGDLDLWDVPARKHLRRLVKVASLDTSVLARGGLARFLHDGDLAYLDSGGGVAFFDRSDPSTARMPIVRGNAKALRLTTDPTGRWLAVGWNDGHIDLHDVDTGSLRRSFGWDGWSTFVLGPNGDWLALQGPGPVRLVPTAPGGGAFGLEQRSGHFSALALSPDGARLAAVEDRAVVVWDLASRRELLRLSGHKETVSAVAFSPDGSLIATSCGDAMTRIWDARDGRPLTSIPGPWYMQSLAFSPDGAYLAASSSRTGLVCLYQLEGRREQRRLIGHKFGVHRLVFHPSLPRLASSSDDHSVTFWDVDSTGTLSRSEVHNAWVTGLAIRPDGSLIASTMGDVNQSADYSIRLTDAASGAPKGRLAGNSRGVNTLAFDPTGHRIASGDTAGTVLLFEVDTGKILRREVLRGLSVSSLVFLNGGRSLLVGQEHGTVTLIDLDGSAPQRWVNLPGGCIRLVVNRQGNRAIVGDNNGSLIGLSLPDLRVVHRLEKAHDDAIPALAWSPDGLVLASGGKDRRVVLRDPETFQPLLTFPPWTGPLTDVAFASTGRWLAYAGADSEIALWDLGRVREELAAEGLAWDQSAPRVVSSAGSASIGERTRPRVPVVSASVINLHEFQEVRRLVNSGIDACRQGRFQDAVPDLELASGRLQALRQSHPGDRELASQLGYCLACLSTALRASKRPVEAQARGRECLAAYESLKAPNPGESFNMALTCVDLSDNLAPGSTEEREKLDAQAVRHLHRAIGGEPARYLARVLQEAHWNRLRNRADFRGLMADATFPRDPFQQPSPIPISRLTPRERRLKGEALIAEGRTLDAIPYLASAWEANPRDDLLLLRVAALQAWFHQDAELAATCQKAREFARGTGDPGIADAAAKSSSLRPPDDPAYRAATLAFARLADELGKGTGNAGWLRMGLGIAEYRSGDDAGAVETLRALIGDGSSKISVTSAFYLAMSLSRQGQDAEARRVATEAISRMKPLPRDENNPLAGGANHDDLILWMAYKEATALLKLDAGAASPSGR
jgi:eukaryotic-like serine/threonine-protein kinase